jgi:hypothetical protein
MNRIAMLAATAVTWFVRVDANRCTSAMPPGAAHATAGYTTIATAATPTTTPARDRQIPRLRARSPPSIRCPRSQLSFLGLCI